MKILLTNGDNIRTLSFFRAICNLTGFEVHVAAEREFNACFFSKYCKYKLINVSPKADKHLFLKQISNYCRDKRIQVLIPMNADELDVILQNRKMFPGVDIPFPDYEKFKRARDKLEFAKIATEAGVKTPKIYQVKTMADLEKIAKFPVIVKIKGGSSSKGVKKASNLQELKDAYIAISRQYKTTPFVQEYVDGENLCSAAVCNNGKILSVSCFKTIRQLPVEHGTGTARMSIRDKKLEDETRKILKLLPLICQHFSGHKISRVLKVCS